MAQADIQAAILVTDTIKSSLKYFSKGEGHKKITILLHPILEAYLVHGEPIKLFKGWYGSSVRIKWEKELGHCTRARKQFFDGNFRIPSLHRQGRRARRSLMVYRSGVAMSFG